MNRSLTAISVLTALLLGVGPATKPVDHDTTEYTADRTKAHFRVPKTWQRRDVPNADAQVVFFFDPAPKKKPSQVTFQQFVSIYLSPAKETQKTLDDVIKDTRDALKKLQPGVKFTKEAAVKFAGHDAFAFHWTTRTKVTSQMQDGSTTNSYVDTDRVETVWLEHDSVCQVGCIADTRFMPSLLQKAESVAKTIGWE